MTIAHAYLPQLFAMVALSFAVALCILVTRFGDLIARRQSVSYYEDWDGTGASVSVMRPTRQLTNLFEFPILFYLLVTLVVGMGIDDPWLPALCWIFVVLRWAHAVVHVGFNRLWIRTPVFMLGQFVLLALWIRFGVLSYS